MPETNTNDALAQLAKQLSEHAQEAQSGTTASIRLDVSGNVSLGFDPGRLITPEQLREALIANFIELLNLDGGHSLIENIELTAVRDE